ncbi:hypothetical protein L484_018434 [Morus notabilis]|uniref:Disease resistance protein winged helix domain-containing protein n=1 Tax=Morus notabilis TaxID=981085 RepID=W9QK88_9ROSA|nr:hypothetical protein L484_018434 [Morus notabilis]
MLAYCGGLALAITVFGGVLWNKQTIRERETLHKNIKIVLRKGKINEKEDSFLDFKIRAKESCREWMAEGFVSNEDAACKCWSELVERCIAQVAEWGSTGRIKTCRIHDLMRDFCVSKAQEGNFLQSIDLRNQHEAIDSSSVNMTTYLMPTYKVRRLAIYFDYYSCVDELLSLIRKKDTSLRSLLCFNPKSDKSTYEKMVCSRKGFPKLESLSINYLEYLEEWKVEEGALLCLSLLHIRKRRKLRTIPDGLRYVITLKEIVFQSMPKKFKERISTKFSICLPSYLSVLWISSIIQLPSTLMICRNVFITAIFMERLVAVISLSFAL